MRICLPFFCLTFLFLLACGQKSSPILLGGPCEGCEAVFEFGDMDLKSEIVIPKSPGDKLILAGTVYAPDGITPAAGVVMYVYHTDANGIYPATGKEKNWARRHGNLRGWLRTDSNGQYKIETIRPASYPNTTVEQHIHTTILEPDGAYYYIESYLFDDDPFLADSERSKENPRGGTGHVIELEKKGNVWYGFRNIVLRSGL